MICLTCGLVISGDYLSCPKCTEQRSAVALHAYQMAPLRQVVAGEAELVTRAIKGIRHVQMFGGERTFCGLPVSQHYRRGYIPYDPIEFNRICADCRSALVSAMEEAAQ
jgi:hypothetical protein